MIHCWDKIKFSFLFFLITVWTIGCTTHSFDTKNYEESLYEVLCVPAPEKVTVDSATRNLGQIIESAVIMKTEIPPGAYADYGSLLDVLEKPQEAKAAWTRETELYPESKPLLKQLISKIESSPHAASVSDNQELKMNEGSHRLRSILVWPPVNQTQQPAAEAAFQTTIRRPLIDRGYYIFPLLAAQNFLLSLVSRDPQHMTFSVLDHVKEKFGARAMLAIENYLANLAIRDPQYMTPFVFEQVKNQLGADAILLITITEWNKPPLKWGGEGRAVQVGVNYRLIEVPSGKDLWRMSFRKEVNERVSVGVYPVSFEFDEHLVPARVLNRKAINAFSKEFPPGPYLSSSHSKN